MAVTQHSVTLNDWAEVRATIRKRTTSTGTRQRVTLDIKANPITFNVDPLSLGRGVAVAIATAIGAQIRAIGSPASLATQLARKYARAAFDRGDSWATRRYAGGRMGPMRPGAASDSRLFNDSGRLAKGIHAAANPKERAWTINVPANRLDARTFKGAGLSVMIEKLRSLVPGLLSPASLVNDPGVRAALYKAVDDMAGQAEDMKKKILDEAAKLVANVREFGEAIDED